MVVLQGAFCQSTYVAMGKIRGAALSAGSSTISFVEICPCSKHITYVFSVPRCFYVFTAKTVMHRKRICREITYSSVRECKPGRHKRNSSKATAGISGKYISGSICQEIMGKSGNHYGEYVSGINLAILSQPKCIFIAVSFSRVNTCLSSFCRVGWLELVRARPFRYHK